MCVSHAQGPLLGLGWAGPQSAGEAADGQSPAETQVLGVSRKVRLGGRGSGQAADNSHGGFRECPCKAQVRALSGDRREQILSGQELSPRGTSVLLTVPAVGAFTLSRCSDRPGGGDKCPCAGPSAGGLEASTVGNQVPLVTFHLCHSGCIERPVSGAADYLFRKWPHLLT